MGSTPSKRGGIGGLWNSGTNAVSSTLVGFGSTAEMMPYLIAGGIVVVGGVVFIMIRNSMSGGGGITPEALVALAKMK